MSTPTVTIGGVPIQAQGFSWAFTAGVTPYSTSFIVPNYYSEQLKTLINPVIIDVTIEGSIGKTTTQGGQGYTIANCWLLEPTIVDAAHVSWSIADNRFSLRGKTITCSYNRTRQKNSYQAGIAVQTGTPAELRLDFDVFGEGRYLPWSVKKAEGEEKERPWTMQEILQKELIKLGIATQAFVDDTQSYYLENIELNARDVYDGLQYLLRMARYDMSIDASGAVYTYNVDYFDRQKIVDLHTEQKGRTMTSGQLFFSEKKRVRPKKVTVYFERKEEIWLTHVDSEMSTEGGELRPGEKLPMWSIDDIQKKKVIGVENVVCIPFPQLIDGKEYRVGEWLPMWKFLKAIDLKDSDVRERWFSGALESLYVADYKLTHGALKVNETYCRQVIAAVRQHYRQTFRIDPLYMDQIENWDTRRVGVVDNYSHFSPPSPLFADFTVVPHVRQPTVAKRTAGWEDEAYVWNVDIDDPNRAKPTPGTISIVSQPLGIFRISYPQTMYSALHSIIPFGIDKSPTRGIPNSTIAIGGFLMKSCKIKENFNMQTIVSIVRSCRPFVNLDYRYDESRFYWVTFDNLIGGEGPETSFLSTQEYARYAINTKSSSDEIPSGSFGSKLINLDIVTHLARSEVSRFLHNYDDYPTGHVTFAGIWDIPLMSNLASITWKFSPSNGMQTHIAYKPVPGFTLEQKSNQEMINYLNHHVSRGGDKNLSQGGCL